MVQYQGTLVRGNLEKKENVRSHLSTCIKINNDILDLTSNEAGISNKLILCFVTMVTRKNLLKKLEHPTVRVINAQY